MLQFCLVLSLSFVMVFFFLLRAPVPYGRHAASHYQFLPMGPLIPATISWSLQESPSLIIPLYFLVTSDMPSFWNALLLSCMIGHYFNRFQVLFPSSHISRAIIYPCRLSKARPVPLFVTVLAFLFCAVNGYLQGRALMLFTRGPDLLLVSGIFLFCLGLWINISSDNELLRLRSKGSYGMPRGGLFDLVSCPNYLGEIIEWAGFAIACSNLVSWTFAWCTTANLVPRALQHDAWYRSKFEEYPKRRKALIPWLL